MPRACFWLLLIVAALPLAGCQSAYFWWPTDEPTKSVPAEYTGLGNGQMAVVVRTLPSTELEDATLTVDLERAVMKSLQEGRFSGLTFTPQQKIIEYRARNYYGTETDSQALNMARKMNADMLLWLHVDYYAPNQPMQMSFMQGRLTVNCRLIDCKTGERKWEKPDLTVQYPPKKYGGVATNAGQTRRQLLELFGLRLTDCFRRHEEPLDEE